MLVPLLTGWVVGTVWLGMGNRLSPEVHVGSFACLCMSAFGGFMFAITVSEHCRRLRSG